MINKLSLNNQKITIFGKKKKRIKTKEKNEKKIEKKLLKNKKWKHSFFFPFFSNHKGVPQLAQNNERG
jgi:hypothetical protein